MDFDSLKVTAKINSGNYEGGYEAKMPKTGISTAKVSDVKVVTTADTSNAAKDSNEHEYDRESYLSQLSSTIDVANEHLKSMMIKKQFSYRVHAETNRVIVDVKNSETGEVIKEIPSENDLDTLAKIQELAGIFIDEKR